MADVSHPRVSVGTRGQYLNLRTQISERLWEAIAGAYDAGNYAHAVLESMHVVTTVLRDKSGLDGDGNQLVGRALGVTTRRFDSTLFR